MPYEVRECSTAKGTRYEIVQDGQVRSFTELFDHALEQVRKGNLAETCPICGRSRKDVCKSFSCEEPILKQGVSVALGKGRASCVECGLKLIKRRDERANSRVAQSASGLPDSLMKQCRELVAKRNRLRAEAIRESNELERFLTAVDRLGTFWGRLKYLFTGKVDF